MKRHQSFTLNFKGIAYKTEWTELPDIEAVAKRLGAPPHTKNGSPFYTLPIIYDPSTKAVVSDSLEIAEYLDKTYPTTPQLLPAGSHALIAAFWVALSSKVASPIYKATVLPTWKGLSNRSAVYYRTDREASFGMKLEDIAPVGSEVGEQNWRAVQAGFAEISSWLEKNQEKHGNSPPFVMGDTTGFADIMVVVFLMWMKVTLGEDSEQWKEVRTWDDGRWGRVMSFWEKYNDVA